MKKPIRIGQVIVENDPRGGSVKTIVEIEGEYVICRAGWTGDGRRSRIKKVRIAGQRYSLLRDAE